MHSIVVLIAEGGISMSKLCSLLHKCHWEKYKCISSSSYGLIILTLSTNQTRRRKNHKAWKCLKEALTNLFLFIKGIKRSLSCLWRRLKTGYFVLLKNIAWFGYLYINTFTFQYFIILSFITHCCL